MQVASDTHIERSLEWLFRCDIFLLAHGEIIIHAIVEIVEQLFCVAAFIADQRTDELHLAEKIPSSSLYSTDPV